MRKVLAVFVLVAFALCVAVPATAADNTNCLKRLILKLDGTATKIRQTQYHSPAVSTLVNKGMDDTYQAFGTTATYLYITGQSVKGGSMAATIQNSPDGAVSSWFNVLAWYPSTVSGSSAVSQYFAAGTKGFGPFWRVSYCVSSVDTTPTLKIWGLFTNSD